MSYCTQQDLIDRLSATGLVYVADDDGDQAVSGGEEGTALDAALASADAEIDAALLAFVTLPIAGANEWLRHRAVDLAVERAIERKGQTVPTSLMEAARRSRQWLEMIRTGAMRVPGLEYTSDASTDGVHSFGRPRVINPTPGE